jgi:hypothetical protein
VLLSSRPALSRGPPAPKEAFDVEPGVDSIPATSELDGVIVAGREICVLSAMARDDDPIEHSQTSDAAQVSHVAILNGVYVLIGTYKVFM